MTKRFDCNNTGQDLAAKITDQHLMSIFLIRETIHFGEKQSHHYIIFCAEMLFLDIPDSLSETGLFLIYGLYNAWSSWLCHI